MIDKELTKMMTQTVTINPFVSYNTYGENTYGSSVTYTCRVEQHPVQQFGSTGPQQFSPAIIYLNTFVTVDTRSKVTLADGSDAPLLAVDYLYDEKGPYSTALVVGSGRA